MTIPPLMPRHPITSHPFDDQIVGAIANALGTEVTRAPFQHPATSVYRLVVENTKGLTPTTIDLWPALGRVDVISPSSTVVFTDIRTVDLVGTVEVQFRRSNRDLLIVARGGQVIVRA